MERELHMRFPFEGRCPVTPFPLRRSLLLAVLLAASVAPGASAQTIPPQLTLEDALRLAESRNPLLLADLNNVVVADWNLKAAHGALLPTAGAGSSFSWQGSGEQQLGSITLSELGFRNQPSYYFSSYRLGLSYTLDGRILLALPQARAERRAQQALGETSRAQVRLQVTQAYLDALRQQEGLVLAERELERAEANLRLTRGRQEVGSGTPLEVRQAEVAVGRAQVAVLTARNGVRTSKLRLAQLMGFEPQDGFTLVSSFEVSEPDWSEGELLGLAEENNPALRRLKAALEVQEAGVKMARAAFFPTLSLSASLSGFAREASSPDLLVSQAQLSALSRVASCEMNNEVYRRLLPPLPTQDCSRYLFTEEQRRAIVEGNNAFPFSFTRQPPVASLSISLPLFEGRRRQRDLEVARVSRQDLQLQLKDQELRLRTDLSTALGTLRTAYQAARIEEQNGVWADEQLRLAQERYRLGTASFLELLEAETIKARADRDRLAAIFSYHEALASLEALVGINLRAR